MDFTIIIGEAEPWWHTALSVFIGACATIVAALIAFFSAIRATRHAKAVRTYRAAVITLEYLKQVRAHYGEMMELEEEIFQGNETPKSRVKVQKMEEVWPHPTDDQLGELPFKLERRFRDRISDYRCFMRSYKQSLSLSLDERDLQARITSIHESINRIVSLVSGLQNFSDKIDAKFTIQDYKQIVEYKKGWRNRLRRTINRVSGR